MDKTKRKSRTSKKQPAEKWPKQKAIRYYEANEKEFKELMQQLGINTWNKMILSLPGRCNRLQEENLQLRNQLSKSQKRISDLENLEHHVKSIFEHCQKDRKDDNTCPECGNEYDQDGECICNDGLPDDDSEDFEEGEDE